MHLLKYQNTLQMKGRGRLVRIDYRKMLDAPCMGLEHRGGVCPCGIDHAIEDETVSNTILTSLKTSIISQMTGFGTPTALRILQIATGTSSAATTAGMPTLGAECYRLTPSETIPTGAGLSLTAFWFLGATVANVPSDLQEWGIFGGGATSSPNSGTMLARFLQQKTKNGTTTLSGQYDFTVG